MRYRQWLAIISKTQSISKASSNHTLFRSQEPQLIRRTRIEWVTLAVVAVLQYHTKAIGRFHKDLDDL